MKIDSSISAIVLDLGSAQGDGLAREIGGVFCKVDVASEAEADAAFAQARSAVGQEHVLVNCAGIGDAFKTASRDKVTLHRVLDAGKVALRHGRYEMWFDALTYARAVPVS